MQAKKNLAWTLVRDFHSAEAAEAAAHDWAGQFQKGRVAEDAPVVRVSLESDGLMGIRDMVHGHTLNMPALLQLAGLAASKGEATRKLAENAVSVNGEKFSGKLLDGVKTDDPMVVRLGKKSVRIDWVS